MLLKQGSITATLYGCKMENKTKLIYGLLKEIFRLNEKKKKLLM